MLVYLSEGALCGWTHDHNVMPSIVHQLAKIDNMTKPECIFYYVGKFAHILPHKWVCNIYTHSIANLFVRGHLKFCFLNLQCHLFSINLPHLLFKSFSDAGRRTPSWHNQVGSSIISFMTIPWNITDVCVCCIWAQAFFFPSSYMLAILVLIEIGFACALLVTLNDSALPWWPSSSKFLVHPYIHMQVHSWSHLWTH